MPILLAAVAVGGCGDDDRRRDPDPSRPDGTVVVEPVVVEGGAFIEGFVAGTDVDGDETAITEMKPLGDEAVKTPVAANEEFDVRVLVYPCDGSCQGWQAFAGRYEEELGATIVSDGRLAPFVTECRGTFEVEDQRTLRLTPTIHIPTDGTGEVTCELVTV